jgi:hypothetical protein
MPIIDIPSDLPISSASSGYLFFALRNFLFNGMSSSLSNLVALPIPAPRDGIVPSSSYQSSSQGLSTVNTADAVTRPSDNLQTASNDSFSSSSLSTFFSEMKKLSFKENKHHIFKSFSPLFFNAVLHWNEFHSDEILSNRIQLLENLSILLQLLVHKEHHFKAYNFILVPEKAYGQEDGDGNEKEGKKQKTTDSKETQASSPMLATLIDLFDYYSQYTLTDKQRQLIEKISGAEMTNHFYYYFNRFIEEPLTLWKEAKYSQINAITYFQIFQVFEKLFIYSEATGKLRLQYYEIKMLNMDSSSSLSVTSVSDTVSSLSSSSSPHQRPNSPNNEKDNDGATTISDRSEMIKKETTPGPAAPPLNSFKNDPKNSSSSTGLFDFDHSTLYEAHLKPLSEEGKKLMELVRNFDKKKTNQQQSSSTASHLRNNKNIAPQPQTAARVNPSLKKKGKKAQEAKDAKFKEKLKGVPPPVPYPSAGVKPATTTTTAKTALSGGLLEDETEVGYFFEDKEVDLSKTQALANEDEALVEEGHWSNSHSAANTRVAQLDIGKALDVLKALGVFYDKKLKQRQQQLQQLQNPSVAASKGKKRSRDEKSLVESGQPMDVEEEHLMEDGARLKKGIVIGEVIACFISSSDQKALYYRIKWENDEIVVFTEGEFQRAKLLYNTYYGWTDNHESIGKKVAKYFYLPKNEKKIYFGTVTKYAPPEWDPSTCTSDTKDEKGGGLGGMQISMDIEKEEIIPVENLKGFQEIFSANETEGKGKEPIKQEESNHVGELFHIEWDDGDQEDLDYHEYCDGRNLFNSLKVEPRSPSKARKQQMAASGNKKLFPSLIKNTSKPSLSLTSNEVKEMISKKI